MCVLFALGLVRCMDLCSCLVDLAGLSVGGGGRGQAEPRLTQSLNLLDLLIKVISAFIKSVLAIISMKWRLSLSMLFTSSSLATSLAGQSNIK